MRFQEKRKTYINTLLNSNSATKTIKNSSWLVSDKIFTMGIAAVITAIIARYFGPEIYGQFNYALSFTALFTAVSTLGLETLTVKSIVDNDYDEGTILCTSLYLRVFGGVVLTFLSALIIRLIEPDDRNLHILVLIFSMMMVMKSLEVIEYWIQAHQNAKISSTIRMSASIITAALKVILVAKGGNLVHFAFIYVIDVSIIGAALMLAYFKIRGNKIKWKFSFSYARVILSQSWYLILSGIMVTLYMKIDQVMLGGMLETKTELGIYSGAVQIASLWYFIPMAIITSFNPVIMRMKKNNDEGYLKSIQLLYTIVAWIGIVFGILISLNSNLIVDILLGPDYYKAASILQISIWAGTFAMLGSARGAWLICEGLQKYSIIYIGIGTLINIILNYMLIPLIGGYGAGIATLVSQVTVSIISPALFKQTRVSSIMILKAFNIKRFFKRNIQ